MQVGVSVIGEWPFGECPFGKNTWCRIRNRCMGWREPTLQSDYIFYANWGAIIRFIVYAPLKQVLLYLAWRIILTYYLTVRVRWCSLRIGEKVVHWDLGILQYTGFLEKNIFLELGWSLHLTISYFAINIWCLFSTEARGWNILRCKLWWS